jgi:hypothetical protein
MAHYAERIVNIVNNYVVKSTSDITTLTTSSRQPPRDKSESHAPICSFRLSVLTMFSVNPDEFTQPERFSFFSLLHLRTD